jgi:acyl CoA:acetate/3-ketoacid CoA transferase beta subunit
MAVFEWDSERNMILKEIAHDTTVDKVRALTEAEFIVSDDLGEFGHKI